MGETDSLSEVTEDGIETALAALVLENASENLKGFIVDSGAPRHFASDLQGRSKGGGGGSAPDISRKLCQNYYKFFFFIL